MQALLAEVGFRSHHVDHFDELLEVDGFRRNQWVFFEERDDAALQIIEGSHHEVVHCFPMIVPPAVSADSAAPEEPLQEVQDLFALLPLNHRERGLHLPTQSTRSIPEDRNAEAAFAVDKADDPLRDSWPFLLIVRTGRIFTAHDHTLRRGYDSERVPPDTRSFQQIASCTSEIALGRGRTRARPGVSTLGPL